MVSVRFPWESKLKGQKADFCSKNLCLRVSPAGRRSHKAATLLRRKIKIKISDSDCAPNDPQALTVDDALIAQTHSKTWLITIVSRESNMNGSFHSKAKIKYYFSLQDFPTMAFTAPLFQEKVFLLFLFGALLWSHLFDYSGIKKMRRRQKFLVRHIIILLMIIIRLQFSFFHW